MRPRVVIAALVALGALAGAGSAAAKGGHLMLLVRVPHSARAGSRITVRWTVEQRGAPFRGTTFLTLVGRQSGTTTVASQVGPAYSARIRVPLGGIRTIEVWLRGFAVTPTGRHPAPALLASLPVAR